MNVTCYFATNAPASACMVMFDNTSFGLRFNGSVHRPPSSLLSSGVINIPQAILQYGVMQELSSIVFDVKVFDVNMDGDITDLPAFEQVEALQVEIDDMQPNPVTSSRFMGKN